MTTNEAIVERLKEAHLNAESMMQKAGFEVDNIVEVVVDLQLPFMGYTVPQTDGFRIVVSGMAVDSGMLEGLLVHEMSHIYRMQTNHPSHNARIIEGVINELGKQVLSEEYKRKIITELVNNIEDLYADDIAMQVFRDGSLLPDGELTAFLQSWVKDEPVKSSDREKDRWVNAAIMANNARALAQMKRHRIEDVGGKAYASNEKLLPRLPSTTSREFQYFMNLMVNLNESVSEEGYRSLLKDYLRKFVEIAEMN